MKIFLSLLFLLVSATPTLSQSASFLALLEKANKGSVDAQNEVGIAYSEGEGIKHDQRKAVYWFRKSAEQGYALGTCNLGLHYGMGWGVPGTSLSCGSMFSPHMHWMDSTAILLM